MHLGYSFQLLCIFSGVLSVVFFIAFYRSEKKQYLIFGRIFKGAMFLFLALVILILLQSIFTNDFSLLYVFLYSDLTLPNIYKFIVLWAGHSGSLLSISFILLLFSFIEDFRLRKSNRKYLSIVNISHIVLILFFIVLTINVVTLFRELDFIPVNGEGLKPNLQNKYMYLTPLFTCLWLVGALMLLSNAMATLFIRNTTAVWLKYSRIWIFFTFVALILQMITSALWSFNSSGNFWKWNTLEIISLLSLLSFTVFIHTSYLYQLRSKLKYSTFMWLLLSFQSVLLYLYLIYGSSLNSFSQYKYTFCGNYILIFIILSSLFYLYLLFLNRKELNLNSISKLTFQNIKFRLINLLFFLVIVFNFAGIIFQISVGTDIQSSDYYIFIIKCFGFSILFLMIFSALYPIIVMCYRKKKLSLNIKDNIHKIFAHLGIILIVTIISVSYYYHWNKKLTLNINDVVTINDYTISLNSVKSLQRDNYVTTFADISVDHHNKFKGSILPAIRGYSNSMELIAKPKYIICGFNLISIAFTSYDFKSNEATIFVMARPYILLVIPFVILLILGLFIGIIKLDRIK